MTHSKLLCFTKYTLERHRWISYNSENFTLEFNVNYMTEKTFVLFQKTFILKNQVSFSFRTTLKLHNILITYKIDEKSLTVYSLFLIYAYFLLKNLFCRLLKTLVYFQVYLCK